MYMVVLVQNSIHIHWNYHTISLFLVCLPAKAKAKACLLAHAWPFGMLTGFLMPSPLPYAYPPAIPRRAQPVQRPTRAYL